MFDLTTTLLAIFLLGLSGLLISHHLRSWRRARVGQSDAQQLHFAWRQCRRRLQSSGMLALVSLGLLVWPLVTGKTPRVFLLGGMVLLLLWIVLLALADVLHTQQHYRRIHRHYEAGEAELKAQLGELLKQGPTGQSGDSEHDAP